MADKKRQSSSSTSATSESVMVTTGTGTVDSAELVCGCPEPGPATIQVEQVLGANMEQRVVEFDMTVPDPKPSIEQVIDVFVKDVCIKSVDVIPNKVIVRGKLEVKVLYVADLPSQPVHAFEREQRWTRDIVVEGAMPDMKATADVFKTATQFTMEEKRMDSCSNYNLIKRKRRGLQPSTFSDLLAVAPTSKLYTVIPYIYYTPHTWKFQGGIVYDALVL